jgi:hypothetical protein
MKSSKRGISRKKLFPEAARGMNASGKRVWFLNGKEYPTLRSMISEAYEEKAKPKLSKPLTK